MFYAIIFLAGAVYFAAGLMFITVARQLPQGRWRASFTAIIFLATPLVAGWLIQSDMGKIFAGCVAIAMLAAVFYWIPRKEEVK